MVSAMPQPLYPQGKDMVHCTDGHQCCSGWAWKLLCPLGLKPLPIQPLVSYYTDYAILAALQKLKVTTNSTAAGSTTLFFRDMAPLLGNWCPRFEKSILVSSSRVKSPLDILKMPGTNHPVTQYHIPET